MYTAEQLKQWSGNNAKKRFKYQLPTIKFDGRSGQFSLLGKANEDGTYPDATPWTSPFTCVILRTRRVFSSFERGAKVGAIIKPSIRQYSNEFNSNQDYVTVWKTSKGEKTEITAQGTPDEIRVKLPELKYENYAYVLTESGETMKIKIKGATRHYFYDYCKEAKSLKKDLFTITTSITVIKEQNEGGLDYYRLNFEAIGDSDLEKVGPALKDVAENLEKVDNDYAESFGNKALATKTVPADELPTIQVDEELPVQEIKFEKEPEVKLADIPF